MRGTLRWRSRIGFCAIVAIVLNALAPTLVLAKAVLEKKPVAYTQICTTQGLVSVAIDASGDEGADSSKHTKDCPFCRIQTSDVLLLDTDLDFAPPRALHFSPPLFFTARDPLFSWVAHPSRGPPAHS